MPRVQGQVRTQRWVEVAGCDESGAPEHLVVTECSEAKRVNTEASL